MASPVTHSAEPWRLTFAASMKGCKAGINIDGKLLGTAVQDGLKVPFLFLLSDHTRKSDSETAQIKRDLRSVAGRLPNDPNLLMLTGADHFGFSDDCAMLKSPLLRRWLQWVGVIAMDGRRQLDLTSECVHRFFDIQLENQPDMTTLGCEAEPEIKRLN